MGAIACIYIVYGGQGSLESQISAVIEEYQQGKVPCAHCMHMLAPVSTSELTNKNNFHDEEHTFRKGNE